MVCPHLPFDQDTIPAVHTAGAAGNPTASTLVVHGGCVWWWNGLRWATGVVSPSSRPSPSGRRG